jgi:hypothetical protein
MFLMHVRMKWCLFGQKYSVQIDLLHLMLFFNVILPFITFFGIIKNKKETVFHIYICSTHYYVLTGLNVYQFLIQLSIFSKMTT